LRLLLGWRDNVATTFALDGNLILVEAFAKLRMFLLSLYTAIALAKAES
jgi:hypothetical protein